MKQRCRHCGCTDERGCRIHLGYDLYISCYWVAPGLCSNPKCIQAEREASERRRQAARPGARR